MGLNRNQSTYLPVLLYLIRCNQHAVPFACVPPPPPRHSNALQVNIVPSCLGPLEEGTEQKDGEMDTGSNLMKSRDDEAIPCRSFATVISYTVPGLFNLFIYASISNSFDYILFAPGVSIFAIKNGNTLHCARSAAVLPRVLSANIKWGSAEHTMRSLRISSPESSLAGAVEPPRRVAGQSQWAP